MKIGKLRTGLIILQSLFVTGYYSIKAVSKSMMGKPPRAWVDQLLDDWVTSLLKLVQADWVIHNPHGVNIQADQPTIIMCNHTSAYDIPLGYKAFPMISMRMLAKKELSHVPFLGRGMRASEFPFVDRKNRNQAMKDLAYARQLMDSGIVLWIAPEGTRSMTGKLMPFKKGGFITAINTKAIIIPMAIRGAYDILPPKTWRFNLKRTAEIHIGQPVNAAEYTHANKDELIALVHKQMKTLAGE